MDPVVEKGSWDLRLLHAMSYLIATLALLLEIIDCTDDRLINDEQ